jgi:hypothetical protein
MVIIVMHAIYQSVLNNGNRWEHATWAFEMQVRGRASGIRRTVHGIRTVENCGPGGRIRHSPIQSLVVQRLNETQRKG